MGEFLNNVLLEQGYENLTTGDKNTLIATISNELGVEYNKVTDRNILDYHKRLKIAMFKSKCEETIEEGFIASNGHFYRTNRDDQVNMIGKKDEISSDPTMEIVNWKAEDVGSWIPHTREEWLKVYSEAFKHKESQLVKYNILKAKILQCETHQEIVEVTWDVTLEELMTEMEG